MHGSSTTSVKLAQLEKLIGEVLRLEYPADAVVSRFFRQHPQFGPKDRSFLAEGAWLVLRNRTWYSHLSTSGEGSMHRRYALLAACDLLSPDRIKNDITAGEAAWLDHVAVLRANETPAHIRESVPTWLFERWQAELGDAEALACAQAMNSSAPLDLRVNTLKIKPEEALSELVTAGIKAEPAGVLPEAIRIKGKPALQKTRLFTQGLVEVQDLGSQLLARLVAPKRGFFVVDFCAGAGGKTLALGAALKNTGRLYALDTSATRLTKLKPRLARSGLSNVWPSSISSLTDDRVRRLHGKADAVLVDAPCSGLGTLRRNPDLKWRQVWEGIRGLQEKQLQILTAAAKLLKPGARLVYGTCSPLAEENSQVVDLFLAANPAYQRVSAQEVLAAQRIELPSAWQAFSATGDLWLWPHRSGTDGFYAAVLTKSGDFAETVG